MHLYLVFVSCIIFVLTTEMQDLQKGILMIPLTLMDFMDSDESNDSNSPHPLGLLGGGEHFANVSGGCREQLRLSRHRRQPNNAQLELP